MINSNNNWTWTSQEQWTKNDKTTLHLLLSKERHNDVCLRNETQRQREVLCNLWKNVDCGFRKDVFNRGATKCFSSFFCGLCTYLNIAFNFPFLNELLHE